jgi:hypothetical protein
MVRRRDRLPGLEDESVVLLDDVVDHLRLWKDETLATVEALKGYREEIEQHSKLLENPRAIIEYIDFFEDVFGRSVAEFERLITEVAQGIQREHIDTLRQIASNSALEQRRCVMFRDKWINKILPFEEMRPILDGISLATRDQLSDYRELNLAAARLETFAKLQSEPGGETDRTSDSTIGRRDLFNRLFKKPT